MTECGICEQPMSICICDESDPVIQFLRVHVCQFEGGNATINSETLKVLVSRAQAWGRDRSQSNAAPQASPSVAPAVHAGPADAAPSYVQERPQPMPDGDIAGTYAAGWNDCLERSFPVLRKYKRGEAGEDYIKGFNACLSRISSSQE